MMKLAYYNQQHLSLNSKHKFSKNLEAISKNRINPEMNINSLSKFETKSSFESCLSTKISGKYKKKDAARFRLLIIINLFLVPSEISTTKYLQKSLEGDFYIKTSK